MDFVLERSLDKESGKILLENIESKCVGDGVDIVLDAANLHNITADGMDVILKIKKKCKNIQVINASVGIADLFNRYGFQLFIDVDVKYRFVSIKYAEIIGHGGHGEMYRINKDTIVKVYTDGCSLDIIQKEREYARNAFINGIPTAIAYDVVKTEKGYGVVFELIEGQTLGQYLNEHPDELESLAVKFANLLSTLNCTYADHNVFPSIKQVYLDRLKNASKFFKKGEADILMDFVKSLPDGTGMIHGDYHLKNVLIDKNKNLYLIDMADISYGDGFFDIGGAYLTVVYASKYYKRSIEELNGIDCEKCLRLWDIVLKEYYGVSDDEYIKKINKQCEYFSYVRMASELGKLHTGRYHWWENKLIAFIVRKNILKKIDDVKAVLSEVNTNVN